MPHKTKKVPAYLPPPNAHHYTVAELASALGVSVRSLRAAIRRNEVPHLRLGRRIVLPKAAIHRWEEEAGKVVPSAIAQMEEWRTATREVS